MSARSTYTDFETTELEETIEQRTPHRDPKVLTRLYHDRGLSQREIAQRLGVTQGTISNEMRKHGIETRAAKPRRVERATFSHDADGHEQWVVNDPEGTTQGVFVAQLQAISEGVDPSEVFADGKSVHHRNGIPFDNRPANLEVVTREQHARTHGEASWRFDGSGLGCHVLQTAKEGDNA